MRIPILMVMGWCVATVAAPAGADFSTPLRRVAQQDARGLAFDVYIRLREGMTEGELLLRAGKPDAEVVESLTHDIVKTYYYYPTPSDPWITSIRLQGGRIANIDRVKKF